MSGSATRWNLTVLACAALLLSGCSHKPPKPAPKPVLTLTIDPAAGLNPDPRSGSASPVVVRLYQLTSPSDFQNADFNALYRNEAATLGKSLVTRQELTVFPAERNIQKFELSPESRVLGVLVAFSDIDHAQWRAITPADPHPMVLTLGAKSAQLAPQK